jgi:single-strand DNA-binding protein
MSSYNKVILMGNLTRDIEMRAAGTSQIGAFAIAVNRKFKTQTGEHREEVAFVDCEAWGRTAETMAQYLSKGSPVLIDGRLKFDQWEDKNGGGKRSKLVVVVENFQFVGGGQGGGGGDAAPSHSQSEPTQTISHDEIPF